MTTTRVDGFREWRHTWQNQRAPVGVYEKIPHEVGA